MLNLVNRLLSFVRNYEFNRFLVVGVTNTLFSYTVYGILVYFLPYHISYTIAYILGIALSYFLNSRIVFREALRLSKALQFPFIYIAQYLISIGLMYVQIDVLKIHKWVAPVIVTIIVVPLTYLMSRLVFKGRI